MPGAQLSFKFDGMTDPRVKILSTNIVHDGFNRLVDYQLQVASQADTNATRTISREVMECTDAVVVLIYAPAIDSFVLCQEFRTGVYFNARQDNPFILGCVAGMIDKHNNPEDTARAEVREETGLTVTALTPIANAYSSPGRITEHCYLYYAEVDGTPHSGFHGLAGEGEDIHSQVITRVTVYQMMDNLEIIDSMALLCLNWFRVRDKR